MVQKYKRSMRDYSGLSDDLYTKNDYSIVALILEKQTDNFSLLKKKDIVESRRGVSGFTLKPKAEELTLLQIYQAVNETETPRIFDLHQNPSDECIVGRHIKPVLTDMFAQIEDTFSHALGSKTLADCVSLIRKRL